MVEKKKKKAMALIPPRALSLCRLSPLLSPLLLTAIAYATCSSSADTGARPAADRDRARAAIWGSLTMPAKATIP